MSTVMSDCPFTDTDNGAPSTPLVSPMLNGSGLPAALTLRIIKPRVSSTSVSPVPSVLRLARPRSFLAAKSVVRSRLTLTTWGEPALANECGSFTTVDGTGVAGTGPDAGEPPQP